MTFHRQKDLCGSFGIQVRDCETLVEAMTREGCFEKADHAQVAELPSPTTDLKIALSPGDSATALLGIILPQYICQGIAQKSYLPMPQVSGQPTPVLAVDPEGVCILAPTPLKMLILTIQGSPGRSVPEAGPPTYVQLQILK